MKTIVLGGTGLLGQALQKEIKKRYGECITVARKNADYCLDITDLKQLRTFIATQRPDLVINACAIVSHAICEQNPCLAYITNARPSAVLSELSQQYHFKYVYISTDGYFNGDGPTKHSEKSPIKLLNEYARTKYIGEQFTLVDSTALVIRTNIVGFRKKEAQPTFVEWVIQSLQTKEPITLFDDYYTSSISTTQFSQILLDVINKNVCGIVNLASSEISSKKDFILCLAKTFGFSIENTQTGSISSLSTSQRADSLGLDVSYVESILNYKMPNLQEVINQLLRDYHEI